jgi:hypothetical protein
MITVKVSGGIGNQLFQYAVGRGLALRKGHKLYIDKCFNANTPREYALDKFNVKIDGFRSFHDEQDFTYQEANYFEYNPMVFSLEDGKAYYLSGSWQNSRYFATIWQLQNEITLKGKPSTKFKEYEDLINRGKNTVSIHFRRGDFANDKRTRDFHGILTEDYYLDAMAYLTSQYIACPEYYVFTDEPDWFQSTVRYIPNPIIIRGIPDYEQLILMSKCKHNIIANSSFSWWAAWLNSYVFKHVVCPNKWITAPHGDGIYPDDRRWKRLKGW